MTKKIRGIAVRARRKHKFQRVQVHHQPKVVQVHRITNHHPVAGRVHRKKIKIQAQVIRKIIVARSITKRKKKEKSSFF